MTTALVPPPIIPGGVITQEFHTPKTVQRGIAAGVVGNMLEWYDFALFGFFAPQIGAHFFPAHDPTSSVLAAFGTFAAGFVMRPVGGALFGWIGDRYGRKQALIGSVMAMAFPSFLVALLPDAARIGLLAPILLIVLRLIQGIAVGGEYMASAVFLVEGAEPGRRGWMGSWGPFGASAGTLLGSAAGALVNFALPADAVLAWGWRIPFAVGVLVALGGLWIRRHYVERVPQQMPAKSPVGEAFRSHWRTMVHLILLIAGLSVGFYTTFVYSATWLHQIAQSPGEQSARHQHRGNGATAGGVPGCRACERPIRTAARAGMGCRGNGAVRLSADGAHGPSDTGGDFRRSGRTRRSHRNRGRRAPGSDGGAHALARQMHGALGRLQRGDGAARRHHADGCHVAARPQRA